MPPLDNRTVSTNELVSILENVSFSYILDYSAQEAKDDLDRAVMELKELVESMKGREGFDD
jgi:hypothetical protein